MVAYWKVSVLGQRILSVEKDLKTNKSTTDPLGSLGDLS